jgi:hypothetical protein
MGVNAQLQRATAFAKARVERSGARAGVIEGFERMSGSQE